MAGFRKWSFNGIKKLAKASIVTGDHQTKQIKNMLKIIHSNNYGNYVNIQRTISRAAQYRDDPDGNVTHLSKYSFTKKQFKVLCKTFLYNNEFSSNARIL